MLNIVVSRNTWSILRS